MAVVVTLHIVTVEVNFDSDICLDIGVCFSSVRFRLLTYILILIQTNILRFRCVDVIIGVLVRSHTGMHQYM
jgi:hypothetical protein